MESRSLTEATRRQYDCQKVLQRHILRHSAVLSDPFVEPSL
jgi:hypothetical protein